MLKVQEMNENQMSLYYNCVKNISIIYALLAHTNPNINAINVIITIVNVLI